MNLSKNTHQGFTLVELIMVIVLLSIVAGVALPKFFQRSSFDQRLFFDDTLNALRYAQKTAVASGCNTHIVISDNSYRLLRDDSCSSGSFANQLDMIHPANHTTPYTGSQKDITLTSSQATISFNALGQADNNVILTVGNQTITLVSATGFSYDSSP